MRPGKTHLGNRFRNIFRASWAKTIVSSRFAQFFLDRVVAKKRWLLGDWQRPRKLRLLAGFAGRVGFVGKNYLKKNAKLLSKHGNSSVGNHSQPSSMGASRLRLLGRPAIFSLYIRLLQNFRAPLLPRKIPPPPAGIRLGYPLGGLLVCVFLEGLPFLARGKLRAPSRSRLFRIFCPPPPTSNPSPTSDVSREFPFPPKKASNLWWVAGKFSRAPKRPPILT